MTLPDDAARRAAALNALATDRRPPQSFWQRHGTRIAAIAALTGALLIGVRALGRFLGSSTDAVGRATEDLRQGLRNK